MTALDQHTGSWVINGKSYRSKLVPAVCAVCSSSEEQPVQSQYSASWLPSFRFLTRPRKPCRTVTLSLSALHRYQLHQTPVSDQNWNLWPWIAICLTEDWLALTKINQVLPPHYQFHNNKTLRLKKFKDSQAKFSAGFLSVVSQRVAAVYDWLELNSRCPVC